MDVDQLSDWRAYAERLPAMVFAVRADGMLEHLNARCSAFLGLASGALPVGDAAATLVHPDDLPRVELAWCKATLTGEQATLELRARRADGSYRLVKVDASAQRDWSGAIVRWLGVISEVEPAERREQDSRPNGWQIADSERPLRALAESIPVICWTADANGWIDWYNHHWYEYTGQTREEATGWGCQAAHHPEDFLEVMTKWPHSVATGEPFEMEYRLRRHDGAFHWFLTRAVSLRDESGKVMRWYGSNVDINMQKEALERSKRVAEALQAAFLPASLPQRPRLRIDAYYQPAEEDRLVGGDWYDAFELPDRRLVFSIGDVTGHGLEASMLVGRLRQAICSLAFQFDDPSVILREVNLMLRHQEPGAIATASVGFIDAEHTRLIYSCAGHPPPLIAYTNDRPASALPSGGPPLGVGDGSALFTHEAPVGPDTVVALYTDGMTEFSRDVFNVEGRLRAAVALLAGTSPVVRPALAVKQLVFGDLPARDDAALLILQFSSSELGAATLNGIALARTWRFHSSDAAIVQRSRHEIMTFLRALAGEPDELFAGEVIVGEILANTVKHAPGLVEVVVDWTGEKALITVRDSGPGLKELDAVLPRSPLDETGRGVFLIGTLAEESYVRPAPGRGTEVHVVLPVRRRAMSLSIR